MAFADFLESLEPLQAELIAYLDTLILENKGTSRKMRFRVPFYDAKNWFCYLNPKGKEQIELCFLAGKAMQKSFPILQLRGRKMVSGLYFHVNDDLPQEIIIDMIEKAIRLNK